MAKSMNKPKISRKTLGRIKFAIAAQLFNGTFMLSMVLYVYFVKGRFDNFSYLFIFFSFSHFLSVPFQIWNYKKTKERYFSDRRFSTPQTPDGKAISDNSEELEKLIQEEASQAQPEDLTRIKFAYNVSSIVFSNWNNRYFYICFRIFINNEFYFRSNIYCFNGCIMCLLCSHKE